MILYHGLPPYIYGREAGPNEKVWTESAVAQSTADFTRQLEAARARISELEARVDTVCEVGSDYRRRFEAATRERDEARAEVERLRDLLEFAVETAEEIDAIQAAQAAPAQQELT